MLTKRGSYHLVFGPVRALFGTFLPRESQHKISLAVVSDGRRASLFYQQGTVMMITKHHSSQTPRVPRQATRNCHRIIQFIEFRLYTIVSTVVSVDRDVPQAEDTYWHCLRRSLGVLPTLSIFPPHEDF